LHAIAQAVPHLKPEEVVVINEGKALPNSPIAVMAPGTGLGEACLISCTILQNSADSGGTRL